MRKGFTLVELLVVTVVIAILASIVFRLVNSVDDATALQLTIKRMQRLENCLSGYYAAFGSYPPVQLHGSRNPFYPVNKFGFIQQTENEDPDYKTLNAERVNAACRAQPVAAAFPFTSEDDRKKVEAESSAIQLLAQNPEYRSMNKNCAALSPFDALSTPNQLSGKKKESSWSEIQLFKFGLMSFLLPRYLLMMGSGSNTIYQDFAQWTDNNTRPCKFESGEQYATWLDLNMDISKTTGERWKLELIPSQAVTQRWLPNLAGICTCGSSKEFYGVSLSDGTELISHETPSLIEVYSSGDSQSGENADGSQPYVLDSVTVKDGWQNDFFYYSLPPYQSYRLWSAGPNMNTFPPWITDEQIRKDNDISKHAKTIRSWIADDIVHLSH